MMKNLSTFGRQILKSIVITIVAGVMLYLLWALRISGGIYADRSYNRDGWRKFLSDDRKGS